MRNLEKRLEHLERGKGEVACIWLPRGLGPEEVTQRIQAFRESEDVGPTTKVLAIGWQSRAGDHETGDKKP